MNNSKEKTLGRNCQLLSRNVDDAVVAVTWPKCPVQRVNLKLEAARSKARFFQEGLKLTSTKNVDFRQQGTINLRIFIDYWLLCQMLSTFVRRSEPHVLRKSCSKLCHVSEHVTEVKAKNGCTACLGILNDDAITAAIEKIASEINKQEYDCNTFTCALTIPIAVQLRERSLQINLSQKFEFPDEVIASLKRTVPPIKEVWKWIAFPKIENLTAKMSLPISSTCPFVVDVFLVYSQDEEECKILLTMCGDTFKQRSQQKRKFSNGVFSRKSVETAMISTTDDQFVEHYPCPPTYPTSKASIDLVTCTHASFFIGGRYTKYSRELSQTPWFIGGEKKMETSVQELLCDQILKFVKADAMKFLSSGREDVDVRTLHSGRPFAVELLNPRVTKFTEARLKQLTEEINGSTNLVHIVDNLQVISKDQLKTLKEGEDTKTKTYRALCLCRSRPLPSLDPINNINNLEIIQKTPVRVLHRRPLATRPRTIHSLKASWISSYEMAVLMCDTHDSEMDNHLALDHKLLNQVPDSKIDLFILDLTTQAGTYVKEFVHGDFGRTKPSVCEILESEVDIVALDVMSVNLNWP
ncbi:tRNA pseudouridine synthase Pus10 [Neodiprion virginianus]|uniref:tRNA pseudouridine synthase Pus10 n=1 Tax=Neodiprion virginianus TaxID=2961670 RepID=UPI001EE6DA6F|nr:tRNA pseudouridine synthase Pus10 [Neodiprion virginianus]